MIASLGMYDPRWLHWANDAWWATLRATLVASDVDAVPPALDRTLALHDVWQRPDLLLAQTCGYPLVTMLGGAVRVVATPCYAVPGCDGPMHRAALVVRADDPATTLADLAGRRLAINDPLSNTGMNLPRALLAPMAGGAPLFASRMTTGSHARSIWAVIGGRADVASIDAVTLALLTDRYPGLSRRIRVLAWTPPSPGLPLITAATTGDALVAKLHEALAASAADPALAPARSALRLTGLALTSAADYAVVATYAAEAAAQGYPELR